MGMAAGKGQLWTRDEKPVEAAVVICLCCLGCIVGFPLVFLWVGIPLVRLCVRVMGHEFNKFDPFVLSLVSKSKKRGGTRSIWLADLGELLVLRVEFYTSESESCCGRGAHQPLWAVYSPGGKTEGFGHFH